MTADNELKVQASDECRFQPTIAHGSGREPSRSAGG
jgi:hypothetical protein